MKTALMWKRISRLLLGSVLVCAITAHAATLTVTDPGDSGPGTLRDLVAVADPGDTIVFAIAGPITLTSPHIVIDKDLTITGPARGITVQRQVPEDKPVSRD